MSGWWIVLLVGYVVSVLLITGWVHAYSKGKWPSIYDHRDDLGAALLFGLIGGLLLPVVGVVVIFLFTGFAKYGWSLK